MNTYDLVLHVDKVDGSLSIAFTNAINYARALPNDSYNMVLVVNSRAVTQLVASNVEIKGALEEALAHGLSVRVCQNALAATGTDPKSLYPQCQIVPAGLVELVNLQRAGYAYVKP